MFWWWTIMKKFKDVTSAIEELKVINDKLNSLNVVIEDKSYKDEETARRITKTAIPIIAQYSILLKIFKFDMFFDFTPEDIKNPSVSVKRYEGI